MACSTFRTMVARTGRNITPGALPEWALVSIIEPSPHDPASAYLAATCYKQDDFRPYLYKTNDYGKTWTKITTGIPDNDFTRVIREDPVRRGLLYAGTETGLYVSFDEGAHWQSLRLNMPAVPIHDVVIKDDDLVVATHGRSFWILDDISPLRQVSDEVCEASAHLFQPRPTTRFLAAFSYDMPPTPGKNVAFLGPFQATYRQQEIATGEKVRKYLDAGQNPPDGAVIHYALSGTAAGRGHPDLSHRLWPGHQNLLQRGKRGAATAQDPTKTRRKKRRSRVFLKRQEPTVSSGTCGMHLPRGSKATGNQRRS